MPKRDRARPPELPPRAHHPARAPAPRAHPLTRTIALEMVQGGLPSGSVSYPRAGGRSAGGAEWASVLGALIVLIGQGIYRAFFYL